MLLEGQEQPSIWRRSAECCTSAKLERRIRLAWRDGTDKQCPAAFWFIARYVYGLDERPASAQLCWNNWLEAHPVPAEVQVIEGLASSATSDDSEGLAKLRSLGFSEPALWHAALTERPDRGIQTVFERFDIVGCGRFRLAFRDEWFATSPRIGKTGMQGPIVRRCLTVFQDKFNCDVVAVLQAAIARADQDAVYLVYHWGLLDCKGGVAGVLLERWLNMREPAKRTGASNVAWRIIYAHCEAIGKRLTGGRINQQHFPDLVQDALMKALGVGKLDRRFLGLFQQCFVWTLSDYVKVIGRVHQSMTFDELHQLMDVAHEIRRAKGEVEPDDDRTFKALMDLPPMDALICTRGLPDVELGNILELTPRQVQNRRAGIIRRLRAKIGWR